LIGWLELRIVASAGNGQPANHDRVIDRVGEYGAYPRRGKNICGQHGMGGVFRAGESEQIGKVARWVTNLARTVYVI
jgi:hypothetical protein